MPILKCERHVWSGRRQIFRAGHSHEVANRLRGVVRRLHRSARAQAQQNRCVPGGHRARRHHGDPNGDFGARYRRRHLPQRQRANRTESERDDPDARVGQQFDLRQTSVFPGRREGRRAAALCVSPRDPGAGRARCPVCRDGARQRVRAGRRHWRRPLAHVHARRRAKRRAIRGAARRSRRKSGSPRRRSSIDRAVHTARSTSSRCPRPVPRIFSACTRSTSRPASNCSAGRRRSRRRFRGAGPAVPAAPSSSIRSNTRSAPR